MTLRPPLFWLLLMLAAALAAMYVACRSFEIDQSAMAAAVFAIVIAATALRTNAPYWRKGLGSTGAITTRDATITNAFLIMLALFWCGLAFYAIYLGTHVRWQHGWEYGTACMLLGGGYAYYLQRLSNPQDSLAQPSALDRMAKLAGVQAVLIAGGLVWLIAAGKLAITHKGDWAANQLFLSGGFAIICISLTLIKTNATLSQSSGAAAR